MAIYPSKPAQAIDTDFVVCDIENRESGELLYIDTFDGSEHFGHSNWADWFDFVIHKHYKRIYAHNGGGWDWLSFLEWYLTAYPKGKLGTIEINNRPIALLVPPPNCESSKKDVALCDSLRLLNSSLDDAAKKFLGVGKIKLDYLPEWYWDNDISKFHEYHKRDTELLYAVLVKFARVIHEQVAPIDRLGLTIPSTALKAFKTGFLHQSIVTPTNAKQKELFRQCYQGGRVEVFKPGLHRGVNVYDINSLYPSVMQRIKLPIDATIVRTRRYQRFMSGVAQIRFSQRNSGKPALFMVDGIGRMDGYGLFYLPEIDAAVESGQFDISFDDIWVFPNTSNIFGDYVNTLYSLRMTDKDGPLGATCKLLMNSLYGKFAQKPEMHKTIRMTGVEVEKAIKDGQHITVVDAARGLYRITTQSSNEHEHVCIAGMITSEARATLWRMMDASTIYCDTDSIHTTNTLPVGTGLGELKLEFMGDGVYAGKKLYALRNDSGEKVRAKGIRIGGNLGCKLGFSDLEKVAKGATLPCDFRAASTFVDVLKGKSACRFNAKRRRIRNTVK